MMLVSIEEMKLQILRQVLRQCDVVVLMPLQHITFRETDAQEMQKYWGFGKFSSALN